MIKAQGRVFLDRVCRRCMLGVEGGVKLKVPGQLTKSVMILVQKIVARVVCKKVLVVMTKIKPSLW